MFSNTGSTDFRLTDVQQPNTTETLSWSRSCLAFSAKRSQFEAGSTTTGSIFLPITPPLALISSTAMSTTSRSETSLMAMVPDSEWSTPILTVPPPWARRTAGKPSAGGSAGADRRRALQEVPARELMHGRSPFLRGEWSRPGVLARASE